MSDNYQFEKLIDFKTNNNIIGPVGWAQIFLNDELVEEKQNLVLGQGRSFGAQRLFDINMTDQHQLIENYRNHVISHFGVGSGGSVITVDNQYTLQGPHICDDFLYNPISLGNIGLYLNEDRDYYIDNLYNSHHCLKPIQEKVLLNTNFPTNPIIENQYICNHYTKIRCLCRLESGEPYNLSSGESIQISEAGLYAVNTDITNPKPIMFAHICFSPKFKEKEGTFGIKWNILC